MNHWAKFYTILLSLGLKNCLQVKLNFKILFFWAGEGAPAVPSDFSFSCLKAFTLISSSLFIFGINQNCQGRFAYDAFGASGVLQTINIWQINK